MEGALVPRKIFLEERNQLCVTFIHVNLLEVIICVTKELCEST